MFNNCRQFEVSYKDLRDSNCLQLLNIVIKKLRLFDFVIIYQGPLRMVLHFYKSQPRILLSPSMLKDRLSGPWPCVLEY